MEFALLFLVTKMENKNKTRVIWDEAAELTDEQMDVISKLTGFRDLETKHTDGVEITLPKDTKIVYVLPELNGEVDQTADR